jgi:hypothetical protein
MNSLPRVRMGTVYWEPPRCMRRRRKLHASAQETAAKCAAIAVAVAAKEVTAAKDATALERRDGRGRDGVGWVEGRGQGGGEAGVRGRGGGRGRNVRGLGPLASGPGSPPLPTSAASAEYASAAAAAAIRPTTLRMRALAASRLRLAEKLQQVKHAQSLLHLPGKG